MQTYPTPLKLRSGNFSIEKHQMTNIGLTERFVSVFAGAILVSKGLKNPFKPKLWYGAYLTYRGFTGKCFLYDYLEINSKKPQAVNVRGEFTIDKPASEVYEYWRNLNNLPHSVNHLLDVEVIDENTSHWKTNVLGDLLPLDWNAEIVKDEPGHLIGWRSTKDSILQHVGKVEFDPTPDGMGTILKVVLSYHPPVGGVGIGFARLFNPYFEQLLTKEIKNFKDNIEYTAPVLI